MNRIELIQNIQENITDNDNGLITAQVMRDVLGNIVNEDIASGLGDAADMPISQKAVTDLYNQGYRYVSTATPSTTPMGITAEDKVFYIAVEAGDYPNFGQLGITELTIFKSEEGRWVKEGLGIALDIDEKLTELEQEQKPFNELFIVKGDEVTPTGNIPASYIDKNGSSASWNSGSINYYAVTPGDIYVIMAFGSSNSNLSSCAFYSSSEISSATLVKNLGALNSSNNSLIVKVPEGASYMGLNKYDSYGICYLSDSTNTRIVDIESNIDSINMQLLLDKTFYNYTAIETSQEITGKFIDSRGAFRDASSDFKVLEYAVTGGSIVKIINKNHSGVAHMYAFYSGASGSGIIEVGPSVVSSDDSYILKVPNGANYLCISKYSAEAGMQYPTEVTFDEIYDLLLYLRDDYNVLYQDEISNGGILSGKYIASNGGIGELDILNVYKYNISTLAGKKIKINNSFHTGESHVYAFYNSSEFSTSTCVEVGPKVTSQESDVYIITVPSTAQWLGVTQMSSPVSVYSASNSDRVISDIKTDIDDINDELVLIQSKYRNAYAYSVSGENLYVAYNDGDGVETCYWFKKCMANNLYTFYRVGYRSVNRVRPSTDGISGMNSSSDIIKINETDSDNIGPLYVEVSNVDSWIGGNHHYPTEEASPRYLTAANISFSIYADGKEVADGSDGICGEVAVSVINVLYNPAIAPEEGDISLSSPLCYEYTTYTIHKKTIEVAVKHKFVNGVSGTILNYYGMQSMFVGEDFYMTPNGSRITWQSNVGMAENDSFNKEDYPNFNRFIEKNSSVGYYQSTYLYPNFALGDHSKVPADKSVFLKSAIGKAYHRVIADSPINGGMVNQWAGSYTFFTDPLIDDEYLFVYQGTVRGKDILFINAKQAFNGSIPVPKDLCLRQISVIENTGFVNESGTNDIGIGGDGIYAVSSGAASLIVEFE